MADLAGVGLPLPNTTARILDVATGEALGPTDGGVEEGPLRCGELCVRGPQVAAGYHGGKSEMRKTDLK